MEPWWLVELIARVAEPSVLEQQLQLSCLDSRSPIEVEDKSRGNDRVIL